jgi:hypothetical protein
MTSHAEDPNCPAFRFSILGTFSDCLSRQVAEALRIQNSKDFLLNNKNEYASKCLSAWIWTSLKEKSWKRGKKIKKRKS